MKLDRFVMNSGGARNLLRSEGVRLDLLARAERVGAVADAELATLDAPYPAVAVDSHTGRGRSAATVLGVPLPLERARRILGGAIDAAG